MDLKKAYHKSGWGSNMDGLKIYGVGGRLQDRVKAFYWDCCACVKVKVSEYIRMWPKDVSCYLACWVQGWSFHIFNDLLFPQPVMDAIRTAVTDVGTYNIPNTVMDFVTQMLGLTPVLEEAQHANDEVGSDG